MELIKYDAMCTAIMQCEKVDEVKDIRDKAMALEAYAKQAMNTDAERDACKIRLRAERRAGELLAEKARKQTAGLKKGPSVQRGPTVSEYQQAKQEANISDTQAKRWQKLASVEKADFEEALQDKNPSTTGIIKKANGTTNKMNPLALAFWGRVRDLERSGFIDDDPVNLLSEMTETMQADLLRIIPPMIDFFKDTLEGINHAQPK